MHLQATDVRQLWRQKRFNHDDTRPNQFSQTKYLCMYHKEHLITPFCCLSTANKFQEEEEPLIVLIITYLAHQQTCVGLWSTRRLHNTSLSSRSLSENPSRSRSWRTPGCNRGCRFERVRRWPLGPPVYRTRERTASPPDSAAGVVSVS